MDDIFLNSSFSAKMTGHKLIIVPGQFVVEIHGMTQTIPIEFLGNGHRGHFAYKVVWYAFLTHKHQMGQIDPKSVRGLNHISLLCIILFIFTLTILLY